SDLENKVKLGIASDYFYPLASVDDPLYTFTMPHEQIIYTSLDAFYHFIEAATSRASSPMVETLAEEGVSLIAKFLPKAVKEPNLLEARYWLMYSALLAGIAIDNARIHIIHVLEHVLTGLNPNLAHGAGLGILGPTALKRVCSEVLDICTRILRPILNAENGKPEEIARAVARFQESLGFREKLSDYGFSPDLADEVAERALSLFPIQLELAPISVSKEVLKEVYLEVVRNS
ncbi:MAG: iron-containing alcohol dehydrogenase, partial [Acidilobaceae archaeon]